MPKDVRGFYSCQSVYKDWKRVSSGRLLADTLKGMEDTVKSIIKKTASV